VCLYSGKAVLFKAKRTTFHLPPLLTPPLGHPENDLGTEVIGKTPLPEGSNSIQYP
jgi:hypothetical protein